MNPRLTNLTVVRPKLGSVPAHRTVPAPTLWLLLALLLGLGHGQELYRLPASVARVEDGAVVMTVGDGEEHYLPGIGWLSGSSLPPPHLLDGEVYLDAAALTELGLELPRLATVRFGGSEVVRVVLDFAGIDVAALARLERRGLLADGSTLALELPEVLVPRLALDPFLGFEAELRQRGSRPLLALTGPEAHYRVFALEEPTRLVIDLLAAPAEPIERREEQLRPGIRYLTFAADNGLGPTRVHVLELAPGSGEFKVVGESGVPRTLTELADGAFAAINGGYFDTASFEAIGQLRIDFGLLALPTRNRAAIAFGAGGATIARAHGVADVRIDGVLHRAGGAAPGLSVVTAAGRPAGSPRVGVITVTDGVVTANRVGPQVVPEGGFAVVYPPDNRALALVDPGARAGIEVRFDPPVFAAARYALEAGPLLLEGGLPAFMPELEGFERGRRILDGFTQQAGIGLKQDGTVLLVVAETMQAEGLLEVFRGLGASTAMRLDSGGSATLLIDGELVNRSDERRIVNAIVFIANP